MYGSTPPGPKVQCKNENITLLIITIITKRPIIRYEISRSITFCQSRLYFYYLWLLFSSEQLAMAFFTLLTLQQVVCTKTRVTQHFSFLTSRDKICNIVVTDYKTRWFSCLTLKLNFLWRFTSYFFLTFSKNVQLSRSASATKGFSRNCVVSHGNQWRVRDCHFRFTSATFYVFGA